MSLLDELKQVFYDFPFNKHQPNRNEVAHFCEHHGISITFSRVSTTWKIRAPSAIKPWWLYLEPILNKRTKSKSLSSDNNNIATAEVIENA